MEQAVSASLSTPRVTNLLLAGFAVLALLLAAIGIYGVISYSVAQRTHEMGIRTALGASSPTLLKLVLIRGLVLTLIGLAIGLGGSLALTRLLASILYGVGARDPMTMASVAAILTGVAVAACYIPARRATRVDPMVALRYE
jgi:putative ABC transport system permease protein